ncbi:response regulator [Roseiarcaceae bacterium H3SJ34-1]|uniref:response regulator n=1 Tax=Terripilifer ovatus TaxID=3032367 RepID=UPI003AB9442D|nr:response regulator [Roseiarcaceae bacterium H3SJ34-1]
MTDKLSTVILVVEDEPLIRWTLVDHFTELGFETLEAGNADEAIELLTARADISLVTTDVDMPGSMDGLALMRVIRDRWPPVKLIVISSKSLAPDAVPDDVPVLGKPCDFEHLSHRIQSLLGS